MHSKIADVLLDIEAEMRRLELWSEKPASPEQLRSTQPFSIDTMTFPEWTQYVFIVRLKTIIETSAPLPPTSDIAPMAEEYFKAIHVDSAALEASFRTFDQLINKG